MIIERHIPVYLPVGLKCDKCYRFSGLVPGVESTTLESEVILCHAASQGMLTFERVGRLAEEHGWTTQEIFGKAFHFCANCRAQSANAGKPQPVSTADESAKT